MEFGRLKTNFERKLEEAKKKGLVDEPIIPLLELINSCNDFFTTSSCAGRIILIAIPPSWKKNLSKIFFKSHYKVKPEDVWTALLNGIQKFESPIYFKQEPFILHVSASTLQNALKILSIAQESGIKHSGIVNISKNRITIEMQSIERVDAIVGREGRTLIDNNYISELVRDANLKLEITREKMQRFFDNFKSFGC
ncbi:MAG: tRNA-wybutosine modification methyltransferase TYW3 [Nitrososphaeria archaeon]|nr:hypothetical protein [Conexivisphaerales archaeon]